VLAASDAIMLSLAALFLHRPVEATLIFAWRACRQKAAPVKADLSHRTYIPSENDK